MKKIFYILFFLWFNVLFVNAKENTYSIFMAGDIMLGSHFPSCTFLPSNDGKKLFDYVRPVLSKPSLFIGNLEGSMTDSRKSSKCKTNRNCYAFAMPSRYGSLLRIGDFTIMNLANNHSGDFGMRGLQDTIQNLSKNGIHFTGHNANKIAYHKFNDSLIVAVIGFSYNHPVLSLRNYAYQKHLIRTAKQKAHFVIVTFHGGREGSQTNSRLPVTLVLNNQTEYAFGENRGNLQKFARNVIDAGSDFVFGHGPHVPRGIEWYRGKMAVYSLGNFCTPKRFSLKGASGLAPLLSIKINKHGKIQSAKVISFYQTKKFSGPRPDPQNRVAELMATISKRNFGKSGAVISLTGKILLRND